MTVVLLAGTPALAITANGGEVNAASNASWIYFPFDASDPKSVSASGLPSSLSVDSSAGLAFGSRLLSAYSGSSASWTSAMAGRAQTYWGWFADSMGADAKVDTITSIAAPNWVYRFSTGADAGTFNATWSLTISGSNSFGLQSVFGFGGFPSQVTPLTISPETGSGSFSFALAPNTAHSVGFYTNGNIRNGFGLTTDGFANFKMEWSISEGGIPVVPEPATWALLTAGFGMVGLAVRRRRAIADS